jgi:hypothetical protein
MANVNIADISTRSKKVLILSVDLILLRLILRLIVPVLNHNLTLRKWPLDFAKTGEKY